MRLAQVRLQNFRSIVDSGEVPIDERVTVIVGRNEQGKTNFLRALGSFDRSYAYSPSDFPNHLRPTLESKDHKKIPVVTLWLIPESADLLKEVVPNIDSVKRFEITRYFDGHYEYGVVERTKGGIPDLTTELHFAEPNIKPIIGTMIQQAETLRTKLQSHATRFPAFAPSLAQAGTHIDQFVKADFSDLVQFNNLVTTFLTGLKGLPNQDQAIQEDLAAIAKEFQAKQAERQQLLDKNPLAVFESRVPRFRFHSSSGDKIPDEVYIASFVTDPEKTSRGMANLCRVAGLSTQKIRELASSTETQARQSYEDHFNSFVSGGINEFWTQEKYSVQFRIEKEMLSVSISDSSYNPRIPPSHRSEGFQWYLSFYCAFINELSGDPTVLLLDNPALELHSDGQHDIKRFLEEKTSASTQVIYVTHSPAMIDPNNLEQVRKVELKRDLQGTKVTELIPVTDSTDLLEPVRSAIGARLVTSLIVNDFNVLVEGAADKPILEGAFIAFLQKEKASRILVNGSVAEHRFLTQFYQQVGMPLLIYLDADSGGRDLESTLKNAGTPEEKIFLLNGVFKSEDLGFEKGKDFELEDVLTVEFYDKAVRETYPDREVVKPRVQVDKRTNYYEKAFAESYGIGFNKRRVAARVKKMLIGGQADKETKTRLSKLTSAIWDALESQAQSKATKVVAQKK